MAGSVRASFVVRGEQADTPAPEAWMQALDMDLAAFGFVLGYRARAALAGLTEGALTEARAWLLPAVAASTGADQRHVPLFRRFPADVPKDTRELWWKKFVGYYFQPIDQPCLWCEGVGTIHVLAPCAHVVCDVCFDGSKTGTSLNNVATSTKAITRIVPALLAYFAHDVRPSMWDLALFHAAARAEEVWVRGATDRRFVRRPGESAYALLRRLRAGVADGTGPIALEGPTLALLLRGNLALPEGSAAWALFREGLTGVLAASDLLTLPKPG